MKIIYSVLFFSLFILNCSAQELGKKANTAEEANVAMQVINEYVVFCSQSTESADDWVAKNKLLTHKFKTSYKKLVESALKEEPESGLGFDPILDAQDYPDEGFELVNYDHKKGFVTLRGKDYWSNFILVMKVVKEKGKWLVDGSGVINIPRKMQAKR